MRYHSTKEKGNYRGWLYLWGELHLSLEFSWRSTFCLAGVCFEYEDDYGWGGHIQVYPFGLYLHLDGLPRFTQLKNNPELSFSLSDGSFWWSLWTDNNDYNKRPTKWRHGYFDFSNFLLGKSKCHKQILEERDITIPMPEKPYKAHAKLMRYTWTRPRWFNKSIKRVEIDMDEPIPFEGKGTCSHNCGQDATHSMTTGECNSITKGVGILVGSVLGDRVKNGGWSDWVWSKPKET